VRGIWSAAAFVLSCGLLLLGTGANTIVAARPQLGQAPPTTGPAATYQRFRGWITRQPREVQTAPDVLDRYRAKLAADGLSPDAIDAEVKIIVEQGQTLEIDRWNKILTSPEGRFNRDPNAFLVEMIKDRTPGTALDVGMGQGRNALYLAQKGWTVTGFDPAAEAVALAQREAKKAGVAITTEVVRSEQFDFGRARWDLILYSYAGSRGSVKQAIDALKPGGIIVIEGFHRDTAVANGTGMAVSFDSNELLQAYPGLRVIRYEDTQAVADFGLQKVRVVRFCAQKPVR
jgi:SAM-dependent methyltransferase